MEAKARIRAERNWALVRPAATDAHETCPGTIAGRFARGDLAVRLSVRETGFDLVQNLLLRQTGIFQASDFRGADRRMSLQAALQNILHETVRQADKAKSDRIAADGIQLIGLCNLKNLVFGVSGSGEINGRFATDERMLFFVRGGNEGYASVIAQPSLLCLHELGDLGIRRIQLLQVLEAAGPHASLVERTIVR